ncbi:hypothetical protein O181_068101 [Austropuccinia psidii MF-1]|uniref:Integrase catalytic domain-containing protein n=1 Tax=Austropuccinia psidii MF-1 TaxID=1389203 RepID=A0A9Q3I3M9_9BASI|nr:hypothetical protein [Austropuccinia psidii MF-1]
MMKIQEPGKPWEIVHMVWVTGLPPGGDRSHNACLLIVDRFSNTSIFLPCHKDDPAMDTALLIWNRVISLVTEIPSSPQHYGQIFTNYLEKNSFSTAYHPQADGLAERMIQTFTNQTPAILEKGWNPKLPQDALRKDLVEVNPTAGSFKGMLNKSRKHAIRCMEDSFAYAKDKCDKSHSTPAFKVED